MANKVGKNKKSNHNFSGRGLSLYTAVSLSIERNSDIAQKAGYQPNTMYGHFRNPNLSDAILVKYGKAIPFDFSIEYPELAPYFKSSVVERNKSFEELKIQLEDLQTKYTSLLEVHNKLLKEHNQNREELLEAREEVKTLNKVIESLKRSIR